MKKCLRGIITAKFPKDFLKNFIQKNAQKFDIEGIIQPTSQDQVRLVACGKKENVDMFLDTLHKGTTRWQSANIEVEPFIKDKDYRGVFRVIE